MPSILEQYVKATKRSGVAPSGQRFEWRAPTAMEFAAISGGIPSLTKTGNTAAADVRLDEAIQFNKKLAVKCVIFPVLTNGDGPPTDDSVEWLPVDMLTLADLGWLANSIQSNSPMESEQAGEARRVL